MYDYVEMESTYGQKRTLLLKTKFFWLIDSISKFNTNDSSDITYPMFSCRKSFLILLCIERRGGPLSSLIPTIAFLKLGVLTNYYAPWKRYSCWMSCVISVKSFSWRRSARSSALLRILSEKACNISFA